MIVRTKTEAKGGITDREKEQLSMHTRKWIENALSTEPVNSERLNAAIKDLYRVSGLKEPRVVIVPSPRIMALSGGIASAIWYCKKNSDSATFAATHDATRAATHDATDSATDDETRVATFSATFDATDIVSDISQRYGISSSFLKNCISSWWRMHQGGNMWSSFDCYLSALRDVIGLELPVFDKYKAWEDCAKEGGFRIMHEEFCIVSDRPAVLKIDEQNRPHCEDGPSHQWRDGWSLYHWHGVKVPEEWIMEKSLDAKTAITWENMEQRRAACEIVGWSNILKELNAKTIDKNSNPFVGELLEVDLPDIGREKFLKVKCGTDREFALPVPPDMKRASQAQAWLNFTTEDNYLPMVRT